MALTIFGSGLVLDIASRWISKKPFIAITPAGIELRRFCRKQILIPFSEIECVRIVDGSFRWERAWLVTKNCTFSLTPILQYADQARQLDRYLTEAMARYRQDHGA